jgi:hypothetical protein
MACQIENTQSMPTMQKPLLEYPQGEVIMNEVSLNVDFCNWFAGFADGEGCFQIKRVPKAIGYCYSLEFTISLRADDISIIQKIQRDFGYGHIYFQSGKNSSNGSHDRYMIRFVSFEEVGFLVSLFSKYPLLSKKARYFSYWRQAYEELLKAPTLRNTANLEFLYEVIRSIRKFVEILTPPLINHPVPAKLQSRQNLISIRRDDVLEMRESGMTFRQIGARLGITRQGAHQLYHRSIKLPPSTPVGKISQEIF